MEPYYSYSHYMFRDYCMDDGMWCCEMVDGLGKVREDFPKFYSRYSMWAKAHAFQWWADELYRIKVLSTPVD